MNKTHIHPITAPINDVCEMSGLSRGTIYNLIRDKKLASTKIGGRRLVIVESLRQLIADHAV